MGLKFKKLVSLTRKGSDDAEKPAVEAANPKSSESAISVARKEDQGATSFSTSNERQHSGRASESGPGPLGLSVVYTPNTGHKADIVFVHGLGGTSRLTWSKHRDPALFWPSTFLPLEPDLCLARILTFGYDASFQRAGNAATSVLDFAKYLLSDLKNGLDAHGEDLQMGKVPLIFVVHSMGGLVVKEAYLHGQNNPEHESIIKSITAITFLATPHRGTNLAKILNRILQSAVVTGPKQYITDLSRNSPALQKLNEQFRHIAPRLDIVSFYETLPTAIGLKKARVMVVEKDSSVLGYPGETSKALDADHHGICKFESPLDPNYISVRNVLKSFISKIISTGQHDARGTKSVELSQELGALLGIGDTPESDYNFFRDQWRQGTSAWILQDDIFVAWLRALETRPRLLWINGAAATGKSVLSSFIVNSLVERGFSCQYHFLRFSDQAKRSLSLCLRSIALQLAQGVPEFASRVLELAGQRIGFETADTRIVWERLFKSILPGLGLTEPVYWVIDGLDESDDPRALIRFLSDACPSNVPLRILVVGRNTPDLAAAFQKVPAALGLTKINIDDNSGDLRCYIEQELGVSRKDSLRVGIVQRIVEGAGSNFLWARFAVERVNQCHRAADIELALQQLPVGMEPLYDRMASLVAGQPSAVARELASAILQCLACALRVLTISELMQASGQDASEMLDPERSIVDLCGGFAVVDNSAHVIMVHQTAREYLLGGDSSTDDSIARPFRVDGHAAHLRMFLSCMRCLMTSGLRGKLSRGQKPELLDYAAASWASHLSAAPADSKETSDTLRKFLRGQWVLTWIQVAAASGQLRLLVQASKHLARYARRRRRHDDAALDAELAESWSVDLVKLVGKFGHTLQRSPEAIHKHIAPFCPSSSALYQLFGKTDKSVAVVGQRSGTWDDSLARISLGHDVFASSLSAAGPLVAILEGSGNVSLFDAAVFEESAVSPIVHGECVDRCVLNSAATLLATYGYHSIKIWDTSTGKCRLSVPNTASQPQPLAMMFVGDHDSSLLVGADDRRIRSLDLTRPSPEWETVAELDEQELDGHFLNAASHMALSRDGSLVAVAYRGHPLSAWEVDGPMHIGHCWRARDEVARGEVIEAVWHPHAPVVVGLYIEGTVFRWDVYGGAPDELATGASRLALSGDGNLFATGDVRGRVRIYTTADFAPLYQLAAEDYVLDLAFSPDACRLYDLRGSHGNAWEPNALLSYADQSGTRDGDSETPSLAQSSTEPLWGQAPRVDAITALAASPAGRLYCYGTEKGKVWLHDVHEGKLANVHSGLSFLSIATLAWSDDGQHICFSDSSKKVFVLSIGRGPSRDKLVETKAAVPMKSVRGPVLQLIFHPTASHVLVCAQSTIHTISLASGSVTRSLKLDASSRRRWVVHPQAPDLLIGVSAAGAVVLDWQLDGRQVYSFDCPSMLGTQTVEGRSVHGVPDRVLVTRDKKHLLVQISTSEGSREKSFLYLSASTFATPADSVDRITFGPISVSPDVLPTALSSQVALCLAFLPHDRLIFLSKEYLVASWKVSGAHLPLAVPSSSIKPTPDSNSGFAVSGAAPGSLAKDLFPLPGDWINRDCLGLCTLWEKERSLLCPRNGEVAVVRCIDLV
ncbi:NACHT and WD domain protein [Diplogelasinospora grovesii]|uniref:NACHT and WD domain protein n=1 Tax=Diplogelasinospora grovesii TaxID=303347 RepID=A0AAN6S622_9PEZI|nr:NACHT and WD domain protein [Diplogelasinospora grovesii]